MNKVLKLYVLAFALVFLHACGGGGSAPPPPPPPTPPSATSASLSVDEDSSVQGAMSGTAGEGGSLSFAVQTQPVSGTLSVNGADFTYTPNTDVFGSDSFTFTAVESGRSSTAATVTLTINGVDDLPVSSNSAVVLNEDEILQGDVVASDVDGDQLTLTIDTQAANGTVTPGSGTAFTYQPAANFFGTDSFEFTISDGTTSTALATVSIDVSSVNDAPVVGSQSFTVLAGSQTVIDIAGTDVENEALTYAVTTSFTKSVIANDPSTSGSLDVTPTYGNWGADQAIFTANDGQADSNIGVIDLDIQVPATTSTITFEISDAAGPATVNDMVAGANETLFVTGNISGDLVPGSSNTTPQQYIAIHDMTVIPNMAGMRITEAYFGSAILRDITAGIDNDLFYAIGSERDSATTLRFVSLDSNFVLDTNVQVTLPYGITRANQFLDAAHVEGVGFYVLSNDNQLTWVDYTGAVRSTIAIPSPVSTLVHSWTIDDVRVVGNTVYIVGGILECTDDPLQCFGGTGSIGYVLAADMAGVPLSIVELPNFPIDSKILSDGRIAAHIRDSLYLLNADATVVWQRFNLGVDFGNVGLDANEDIYWWSFDRDTGVSTAYRVTTTDSVVWKRDQAISVLGFLWQNDMAVDSFGNMFISAIDRYDNVDAFGRMINIHFDYSGVLQWTEVIEPSDLNSNTTNSRVSVLTDNNQFVSIAGDNIDTFGSDTDGFLIINTVQ